jgi:hypothetical protein
MIKLSKNLAAYVLALSLIASSLILASSSDTPSQTPKEDPAASDYVLTSKYKEDLGLLVKEVIDLKMQVATVQGRASELENCLRQTTLTLTQNQQIIFVCP